MLMTSSKLRFLSACRLAGFLAGASALHLWNGFAQTDGVFEPKMPMPWIEADTAGARWLEKPVLASRLLDNMEDAASWRHEGFGEMTFTQERCQDGVQSIRLTSPTVGDKPSRETGRPFGEAALMRPVGGEDWGDFNRLSFWVYPNAPGFKVLSLLVILQNSGTAKVPDIYGREGLNFFLLQPNRWNHVVWEIAHLSRDVVSGVRLVYRLQGSEPGATRTVCFDFDRLELQRVNPDPFEGWNAPQDGIVVSQTGYTPGSRKSALASGLKTTHFELVNADTAEVMLRNPIRQITGPDGGAIQEMDFSECRQTGGFVVRTGGLVSKPFRIDPNVWAQTIWKTINFFYCERCGVSVPGIHDACHGDWTASHLGEKRVINGGWHDAGDLSQGCVNTAEAVYSMLTLADKLQHPTPTLSIPVMDPASTATGKRPKTPLPRKQASSNKPKNDPPKNAAGPVKQDSQERLMAARLVQEAKQGLAWLLKTRFDDGYRVTWATMDFWTDGIPGTVDDVQGEVRNSPFENYLAASAEAAASRALMQTEPALAEKCLRSAHADWSFANDKAARPGLELASAGALASLELYKATRKEEYADKAFEFARVILLCQQRDYFDWKTPLNGFFYTDTSRKKLLHYSHRGHEQAPIVALAELCRLFPSDDSWMEWYAAVVRHSEYLRSLSAFTMPYGMLPAGVYAIDESDEAWFRDQVSQGIQLDARHYIRIFPVWTAFRGNFGTVLSQTKALSAAAHLRNSPILADVCQKQLQWIVGRNPFSQSTMYGEGHNYAPQYTAMSGDMTGSLPVGIQTRGNGDKPYWPAANCYNYKEVWVHPSSRWLSLMADLNGPSWIGGFIHPKRGGAVQISDVGSGKTTNIVADRITGKFTACLPDGHYTLREGINTVNVHLLPSDSRQIDFIDPIDFSLIQETARDGKVILQAKVSGQGTHELTVRLSNATIELPKRRVTLLPGIPTTVRWVGQMTETKGLWVAVVIPDGKLERRREILGATMPAGPESLELRPPGRRQSP